MANALLLGHGDTECGFKARQSLRYLVNRAVEEHLHALVVRWPFEADRRESVSE